MSDPGAVTAEAMRAVVYRHFIGRAAVLFEVSSDARVEVLPSGGTWRRPRRIDVLTVAKARKRGIGPLDLLAIEIKVDRGDWLADLRVAAKQGAWREIAHRHAYAVPDGLVRVEEVPAGSGLLVARRVYEGGPLGLEWVRRAPYDGGLREVPAWLTLRFAWRLSVGEAKLRGITGEAAGETAEELRGALVKARGDVERLRGERDRVAEAARMWRVLAASVTVVPCVHCGKPVRPRRVRYGTFADWRHVAAGDEPGCAEIRARAGRWAQVEPAEELDMPGEAS